MDGSRAPDSANPFSTRFIRPGAIPFLFPPGVDAAVLVERLARAAWHGQIIGPHGSGKSALLAALVDQLPAAGRRLRQVALHDRERRIPVNLVAPAAGGAGLQLIVDGFEQLPGWRRWWLRRWCRRRRAGLLVTAHGDVGLPTLWETRADLATAQRVVEYLVRDTAHRIAPAEVAAAFARHGGDTREMLFDLYDVYQRRS
jgi:hypothetical protein